MRLLPGQQRLRADNCAPCLITSSAWLIYSPWTSALRQQLASKHLQHPLLLSASLQTLHPPCAPCCAHKHTSAYVAVGRCTLGFAHIHACGWLARLSQACCRTFQPSVLNDATGAAACTLHPSTAGTYASHHSTHLAASAFSLTYFGAITCLVAPSADAAGW